jgi:hypothetical protein
MEYLVTMAGDQATGSACPGYVSAPGSPASLMVFIVNCELVLATPAGW